MNSVPSPDLGDLRVFCEVARKSSFSAAAEALSAVCWADDTDVVDVVVVDDAVDLPFGRKISSDTPTTTTATTAMVMPRRRPRRRLAALSSASLRAWRPAF